MKAAIDDNNKLPFEELTDESLKRSTEKQKIVNLKKSRWRFMVLILTTLLVYGG